MSIDMTKDFVESMDAEISKLVKTYTGKEFDMSSYSERVVKTNKDL